MTCVGLDVHEEFCQAAVTDEQGVLLQEGRIPACREALEAFFRPLGRAKVATEAMGPHEWVYDLLERLGRPGPRGGRARPGYPSGPKSSRSSPAQSVTTERAFPTASGAYSRKWSASTPASKP